MSSTPPGPLARSVYLNWPSPTGVSDPQANPNDLTTFDPAAAPPATGYVKYGDAALDTEQYYRPLERLHGTGLHAAGVASGMQITCVIPSQSITILPGLALDPQGRHIYLAAGGTAMLDPSVTPPTTVPVPATGVILSTAGTKNPSGTNYVVVQWYENWNAASYASDPNIDQFNDTPWLQLVTAARYDPDLHVILGEVVLDGTGNIQSASYGDVGGLQRTSIRLPAQALQLQRAVTEVTSPTPGTESVRVDSVPWGAVRARESGGIEIAVAKSSDQVEILNDGGGNFSGLAVAADQATFGNPNNPGITLNGAEAVISAGTTGSPGWVVLHDNQDQDTMVLDGNLGEAFVQRVGSLSSNVIDVDTFALHIHGADLSLDGRSKNNNRALVDWGNKLIVNFARDYPDGVEVNSGLAVDNNLSFGGVLSDGHGTPLMGSPVRKVTSLNLLAGSGAFSGAGQGNAPTLNVDFGAATQFSAFVSLNYVQNYVNTTYNAAAVAEIYQIDGRPTWVVGTGGILGNCYTPVVINQTGTTVGFRARTVDDSIEVQATIIIFYE